MLLKNKTAVITGCNRGIGLSILEAFTKNGADVIACIRKDDLEFAKKVNSFSKQFKNKINIIKFDLEKEIEIEKAFIKIKEITKQVDILVNNAGVNQMSLFQMTNLSIFQSVFQINFFSIVSLTQKLLKIIVKNNYSKIINIASNAASLAPQGRSAYASSKSALVTFAKVLSKELGVYKINVNSISPGLVNTDMMHKTSKKAIEEAIENSSLKKFAEPEDVANLVVFLASNKSDHITGEEFFITGGM